MLIQIRPRGFTLVELLIGLAITATLILMAVPSFSIWLQNTQIRTAAEAIQNGVQLARAEAVRRNTSVIFQLTSTLDNSCALSTSGTNWVVSLDSAVGSCGAAPSADLASPTAPRIIQTRSGIEGSRNSTVLSTQSSITFTGLGRTSAGATLSADISNPLGGSCAPAGPMRCMRLVVSSAGQTRMCDPAAVAGSTQGC